MTVAALVLGLLVGLGSRAIPHRVVADETALRRRMAVATAVVLVGCVIAWTLGLLLDPGFVLGLLTGTWVVPLAAVLARRSGGGDGGGGSRPR